MNKLSLGDRMKNFYENRTRFYLPRRTYTIIRIDGKAFHTYTKGLKKPFDDKFVNDMDLTAKFLCENIQGVKLAYVQSDEITIVLTDFDSLTTDSWFDGNIQKIVSVSSSLATGKFNQLRPDKLAFFDCRVFTIPTRSEVMNNLIWRQQDCERNSISSVARSLYSHEETKNKNNNDLQEMCFQKGVNWNDFSVHLKRGRVIKKVEVIVDDVKRNKWVVDYNIPIFSQDKDYLNNLIPENT